MAEHMIVEAMAAEWDEQGHRAPRCWRYTCVCGHTERDLTDQTAVFDAWELHLHVERCGSGRGCG
jgi:hypothetical protein